MRLMNGIMIAFTSQEKRRKEGSFKREEKRRKQSKTAARQTRTNRKVKNHPHSPLLADSLSSFLYFSCVFGRKRRNEQIFTVLSPNFQIFISVQKKFQYRLCGQSFM